MDRKIENDSGLWCKKNFISCVLRALWRVEGESAKSRVNRGCSNQHLHDLLISCLIRKVRGEGFAGTELKMG